MMGEDIRSCLSEVRQSYCVCNAAMAVPCLAEQPRGADAGKNGSAAHGHHYKDALRLYRATIREGVSICLSPPV